MEASRVTSTILLMAALTLGCAPGAGPDTTLVETDDPELRALAVELLPDLAARSGLVLREPVRLARRSREELVGYLTAKLDEELPVADAEAITASYRLLGLVPGDLDLRELLLQVYTEQVAGFYDPDSTALFVMDDQPAEALRTVLVHELVHAVQDQAADLDSLTDRVRGNDRQAAAQAAIEGHATLVMLEYLTEQMQGRPVDLAEIPDFAAQVRPALQAMRSQYPALASAPRVVQESLLFPYLEGAGFVQHLWRAGEDRPAPFGEWLPQSTEQILDPTRFVPPGRDDPTQVALEVTGGEARYTNTLGAMETRVLLQEHLGLEADPSVEGWDGDTYVLVDGPGGTGLAWLTVWDDAASRDRFVGDLLPVLSSGFPAPASLQALAVDGRPGALLTVGAPVTVVATLSGDGNGG